MNKIRGLIFDVDGTLYALDQKNASNFSESEFGKSVRRKVLEFFQQHFSESEAEALARFQDLRNRFNGEISLGLEKEHGIDRSEYFAKTWNLEPERFMAPRPELAQLIGDIAIETGILSAAPRVWVNRVLDFLELRQHFEPAIFTGDPDIRKPNPLAFGQIAQFWKISPKAVISIGDQEETDILPAKSLGMTTVRIGREIETQADFLADSAEAAIKLLKEKGMI